MQLRHPSGVFAGLYVVIATTSLVLTGTMLVGWVIVRNDRLVRARSLGLTAITTCAGMILIGTGIFRVFFIIDLCLPDKWLLPISLLCLVVPLLHRGITLYVSIRYHHTIWEAMHSILPALGNSSLMVAPVLGTGDGNEGLTHIRNVSGKHRSLQNLKRYRSVRNHALAFSVMLVVFGLTVIAASLIEYFDDSLCHRLDAYLTAIIISILILALTVLLIGLHRYDADTFGIRMELDVFAGFYIPWSIAIATGLFSDRFFTPEVEAVMFLSMQCITATVTLVWPLIKIMLLRRQSNARENASDNMLMLTTNSTQTSIITTATKASSLVYDRWPKAMYTLVDEWPNSVASAMQIPDKRRHLFDLARDIHMSENVAFLDAVVHLINFGANRLAMASIIMRTFVNVNSDAEVNLSAITRLALESDYAKVAQGTTLAPGFAASMFSQSTIEISNLIYSNGRGIDLQFFRDMDRLGRPTNVRSSDSLFVSVY